jgi:hypothetical protein
MNNNIILSIGIVILGLFIIYCTCGRDEKLFTKVAGMFSCLVAILVFIVCVVREDGMLVSGLKQYTSKN